MHKIFFMISLFHASICFEHMCSSSGGQNCITQPLYQEVKIVLHSLYIRRSKLHYTASISGGQNCITRPLYQEVKIVLRSLWYRGCVMQFWPPDDEHMCSKPVEAWNKLSVKQKFCASNWLITEINILRCTVSKTSKYIVVLLTAITQPINVEILQLCSWPDIFCVIKSKESGIDGACGIMGEKRNTFRVVTSKPEGKKSLPLPRSRWKNNIKMYLN